MNEAKSRKEEECWEKIRNLKSIVETTLDDNLSELISNFDSKEKILEILERVRIASKKSPIYEEIRKSLEELKSLTDYTWEPVSPVETNPDFKTGEFCNTPDMFGTVSEAFLKIQELWREMEDAKQEYCPQDYYLREIAGFDQGIKMSASKRKIEQEEIPVLIEEEKKQEQRQYQDEGVRRSFKKKDLPPIEGSGSYRNIASREAFKEKFQ
jgi:hypothetical protein